MENEAPAPVGNVSQNYQGFHNIRTAIAYTEAALTDPNYSVPMVGSIPIDILYWDTMIGLFSQNQTLLYPVLNNYQNVAAQYPAANAAAEQPEPLILTGSLNNIGVINENYPADYLSLPGVSQLSSQQPFWASAERTAGTDYLEIDLGSVQCVNYLYFEATSKPYTIDVAYDKWDEAPNRSFVPVTIVPSTVARSITNLDYSTAMTNPWSPVQIVFTNSLGLPVYTRFLRIGFTRNPGGSPFYTLTQTPQGTSQTALPYSIEVRNLRVARSNS
jgi:hypothetical protein